MEELSRDFENLSASKKKTLITFSNFLFKKKIKWLAISRCLEYSINPKKYLILAFLIKFKKNKINKCLIMINKICSKKI